MIKPDRMNFQKTLKKEWKNQKNKKKLKEKKNKPNFN